jgi:hypothetical protein
MPVPSSLGVEVPPPVRHLLAAVQAPVSDPPVLSRHPLCIATLAASRCGPERPLGRASVSHCRGPILGPPWTSSAVVHEPWTESTHFSFSKINLNPEIPTTLHKGPCSYTILTHSPHISMKTIGFLKIIPDIPLATFQKLQIGPQNSFRHIFATATPISAILVPKFLESFTLSFHAFIIHVCFIFIDFVYIYHIR